MAYMDYEYSNFDTFQSIANRCGVTVDELMLINNIQPPYVSKPSDLQYLNGTIRVPEIFSGGETFENFNKQTYGVRYNEQTSNNSASTGNIIYNPITHLGLASQNKCFLNVQGVGTVSFPCYPESYTDSHQASVSPQTPLGRSEPFQIYQNTGPRTVSVSFRMDREMTHTSDIGHIVGVVQSAVYPIGNYPIIPRCTLVIGNNCSITGIIESVNTNWSDTIIANQYMVATLDFSVVECTGNPKTAPQVASRSGR